jgi:hypothetical protein
VGRDPVTGRRRYATKTVRGGKREAQRELVTLLHSAHERALARSNSTVADLGADGPAGIEQSVSRLAASGTDLTR